MSYYTFNQLEKTHAKVQRKLEKAEARIAELEKRLEFHECHPATAQRKIRELEARLKTVRDAIQPNDSGPEFICLGDNPEVGEALFKDFDRAALEASDE
jgi:hypothetical protein